MTVPIQDFDEALAAQLVAFRNRLPGARIEPGSEVYGRAVLGAMAVIQVGAGLNWTRDQAFPSTADTAHLERHAALVGLARRAAATASGAVLMTGVDGTVVPAGTVLETVDGSSFVTQADVTVTAGEAVASVTAEVAGAAGNRSAGDVLTVVAPPSGLDSVAEVDTDITGGSEDEPYEELRARVLARMRSGDGGGTLADYERWALEVPGVLTAHALRWRRGPGTVTVAVFVANGDGVREPAGATRLAEVQTALDARRPTCAEVDAVAPSEVAIDVTVSDLEVIDGFDPADVKARAESAVAAFLYGLRAGETVRLTALGKAISVVAGVLDFTLVAPATNVEMTVSVSVLEVAIPGTVTVELL